MSESDHRQPASREDKGNISPVALQILGYVAGLSGAETASLCLVSHLPDPKGKPELRLEVTGQDLAAAEVARKKLAVAMEALLTPDVLGDLAFLRTKIGADMMRVRTHEGSAPKVS